MKDLGTVRPGSTLYIEFDSFGADGESLTLTGLAVTDVEVYKDGSTTQRASDAGYTLLDTDGIDFDSLTGIHGFSISLADNTTSGFWAAGSHYRVVISAVTINSQTVSFTAATFRIGYPSAVLNTTIATLASQTSFTLTNGPAENDALNGMLAIIHDVASAVQFAKVLITDYVGSTKTVTLAAGATFTAAAGDNFSLMDAIDANLIQISGDSTAADNAEAFFDGTGYAGTNNVIPTVTTLTGHTAQTGDSYALANGSAGFVAIDTVVDSILAAIGSPTNLGGGATLAANTDDIYTLTNAMAGGLSLGDLATDLDLQALITTVGAAGVGLTEAGGTGDQLTALATAAALTTVASDLIIVASDLLQVYSDTTHIDSDIVVVGSDLLQVYSDTTIIASDVVLIYSDTTAIEAGGGSLTSAQSSKLTQIHSDLIVTASDVLQIYSDTTIIASDAVLIYSDTTAIEAAGGALTTAQDSKLTQVHSDLIIVGSDLIQVYSDTTAIHSDTTAIHTQATTIASDLVIVASDLLQVYSDTTVIASDLVLVYSDTTAIEAAGGGLTTAQNSKLTQVHSDLIIVGSDLLLVYSDTAAIHTQTTAIASDLIIVASDLLQVYSDTTVIASDAVLIYSDTTVIEAASGGLSAAQDSKLTQVHSDLIVVGSDLLQVYSDTTIIASDLVLVYSDTTTIASDLVLVYSDTTAIHSDTTAIHIQTTTVASDLLQVYSDTTIIASDLVIVESDLLQVYSDTTVIASDVVQVYSDTTAIHSDTTVIASDVVQIYSDTTLIVSGVTGDLTEAYRGTGEDGTLPELLYEIIAHLGNSSITSTTKTLKKLDKSTIAKTYTLDDATTPTAIEETT